LWTPQKKKPAPHKKKRESAPLGKKAPKAPTLGENPPEKTTPEKGFDTHTKKKERAVLPPATRARV